MRRLIQNRKKINLKKKLMTSTIDDLVFVYGLTIPEIERANNDIEKAIRNSIAPR